MASVRGVCGGGAYGLSSRNGCIAIVKPKNGGEYDQINWKPRKLISRLCPATLCSQKVSSFRKLRISHNNSETESY